MHQTTCSGQSLSNLDTSQLRRSMLRVSFTSCIPCTEPCSIQLLRTVYIAVSFPDNNYRLELCLERKREKLDYPRTKRKDESCMLLE